MNLLVLHNNLNVVCRKSLIKPNKGETLGSDSKLMKSRLASRTISAINIRTIIIYLEWNTILMGFHTQFL